MDLIAVNCVALVPIASPTTKLSGERGRTWSIHFNAVVKLEPSPFKIECRLERRPISKRFFQVARIERTELLLPSQLDKVDLANVDIPYVVFNVCF